MKESSPTQSAGFSLAWLLLPSDPRHSENRQSKKYKLFDKSTLLKK